MTHLTNKQRTELLIQLAQEATGLTVEAKGNPPEADIDTWDMLRKKTKRGTNIMIPLNCRWNTASILRNDPRYTSLCYNEHSDQILLNGEMVSDVTLEVIALNFEEHYRYRVTDKALRASVIMVAQERAIEPIKEWLLELPEWDGEHRIEPFFQNVLNAKTPEACEELMVELSCKWFISCVARVMQPGCKMDTCLVLVGSKGMRKSTALKLLAGEEWFSDSNINISHKDSYELLHQSGVWIWELAEMHALQGKTAANAKQFLTSASDRYRPAYAKMPIQRQRRTVFTASTNDYQFLSDGPERRFWIVDIQKKIDTEYIVNNRIQLWAEALHWYNQGIKWWLEEDSEDRLMEYQQSFIIDDPWTVKVLDCIKRNAGKATTAQIMEFLDLSAVNQHKGFTKRIAQICRDCGYEQFYSNTHKSRMWRKKTS
jgi:putative DNA primase/helicase